MNDESVITVESRGHGPAAVEAADRISGLYLTNACLLRRTPGQDEV
ncbi:hypothetical protein ACWENO_20005 [Streptomyces sp. NPDC004436]